MQQNPVANPDPLVKRYIRMQENAVADVDVAPNMTTLRYTRARADPAVVTDRYVWTDVAIASQPSGRRNNRRRVNEWIDLRGRIQRLERSCERCSRIGYPDPFSAFLFATNASSSGPASSTVFAPEIERSPSPFSDPPHKSASEAIVKAPMPHR